MSVHSGRLRRRAFTLVELIVVITVLAILSVILIPVVAKIRASAQSTHCVSNMQQLGRAFTLYAEEHRSLLPAPVDEESGTPWYAAIHPYAGTPWHANEDMSQLANVFRCPTWEGNDTNVPEIGDIGYSMSAATANSLDSEPYRPPSLATLSHPTRTVVLLELTGTTDPFFPAEDTGVEAFATTYLATHESDGCDRHGGAANYLFADGHVGHHSPSEAAGFLK